MISNFNSLFSNLDRTFDPCMNSDSINLIQEDGDSEVLFEYNLNKRKQNNNFENGKNFKLQ